MSLLHEFPISSDPDRGQAHYLYENVTVLNDGGLARIQQQLENAGVHYAYKALYVVGERIAREATRTQLPTLLQTEPSANPNILSAALDLKSRRGYGRFLFDDKFNTTKGEGTVYVQNSLIARHYARTHGANVCYAIAGAIAGAASAIYGKPYYCEETACTAHDALACTFTLRETTDDKRALALTRLASPNASSLR